MLAAAGNAPERMARVQAVACSHDRIRGEHETIGEDVSASLAALSGVTTAS